MTDNTPGLYLCKGCGIGEAVDVGELETLATGEHKIPHCRQHDILCSVDGVEQIKQDIADGTINQVIVGACSRRVMTDRFDFPGAHVVRADLREQVTWTHPAGDEDTQMMAADAVRMGIAEAKNSTVPAPWSEGDFSERILVVGGGLSGLTAAREASMAGHPVLLVEKSDALGGWSKNWSARMPHRPPYRGPQPNDMAALIAEVESDSAITVMTNATVTKTEGMPGKFSVTLANGAGDTTETVGAIVAATGWRPYDANKLGHLGYGASPDVVTGVELEGMLATSLEAGGGIKRKSDGAAPKLIAFIQCAGSRDPDHLPYCSSVCCGVSIKQALQIRQADPDTSVYILYEEMRTPGTAEEFYREAQEAGVIFLKGKVNGVAGDMTVTFQDELLGEEIPMAGLDMVVLATGMVPNSTNPDAPAQEDGADQLVPDIDPLAAFRLAEGEDAPEPKELQPSPATEGGPLLNLDYRQGPHIPMLADGFSDSHFICFPYETRRTGIYTCGPVRRPMDMAESAEDAAGAVMKAVQAVRNARDGASAHPRSGDLSFPKIDLDICTKCRRCTVECPFGAIEEDERDYPIVNTTRCRRCGTCMGACPVRTINFDNYNIQMVTEMIQSVEVPDEFDEKPRVLILACENDALPALDMAGINRSQYSAFVRIIPVRCLGSVSLVWISEALSAGFDGVMLMGCKSGDDYQCHFVKGSAIAKERMSKVGETLKSMMLEDERIVQEEVSIADSHRVPKLIDDFMETIDGIGMNPFKGF